MFIGHLIFLFAFATTAFAEVAAPASEKAVQDDAVQVTGKVTIASHNFVATFSVDGATRTFSGTTALSLQPVAQSTNDAALTYTQASQLTGAQNFVVQRGNTMNTAVVTLANGPIISFGVFFMEPATMLAQPFAGTGTWS